MRQYLSIVLMVVIALVLVFCVSDTDQRFPQDDLFLSKLEQARQGVNSNDEWEPYLWEVDGILMSLVPSGCFMMGGGKANATPVHEVCLTEPYWFDVTEVSNAAFDRFGEAGEASNNPTPNYPRENIKYSEAAAFCAARGGRMPTEAEWEYAGRGPDSLIYPWGNEFDNTLLNYCDRNCTIIPLHQDPETDDGYATTAPVDAFPGAASWVGALGMAGNVYEWVSDWYSPNYYSESPRDNPTGPESGRRRVAKGSCWGCPIDRSYLSHRDRSEVPPSEGEVRSIFTGFRCVIPIPEE
jgi:formylglycine-generating enzyme required for sulfatase activity